MPAKEGLNAHAVLIDELHAQKTRDLWDTLRYAGASRRQPLHLSITTAGYDRHSICWEQHDYAHKVLDGTIEDPAFFAYIAAAGDEDDWTDPEVWQKANPSFGVTIDAEQFAEDCREAQESPAKENSFRRYRLNQWTEQDVRWLSMEKWDACGGALERSGRAGTALRAWISRRRPTSRRWCWCFPTTSGIDVLPFFWVPEEGARQRERRDRVPYLRWIRDGHIEATPGEVIDYDRIRTQINELGEQYHILRDRHRPLERHAAGHATGRRRVRDGRLRAGLRQHELRRPRSWKSWSWPASWGTAAIPCCGGWPATCRSRRTRRTTGSRRRRRAASGSTAIVALIMGLDLASRTTRGEYLRDAGESDVLVRSH